MPDGKVVYRIDGDNSDFKKSTSESEGIASAAWDKIKSGGKAAFAAIGAAAAAAGAAIISLGKESIAQYAEYEQLVGGVETLFGAGGQSLQEYAAAVGKSIGEVWDEYRELDRAQNRVLNNANKAYRTAGMSANEYMETVTSFSASLIQSLGGDTEAAADYADKAIVDMADNANKMGSSMESIQTAYQGFAKQNYTMLDNLKLGYGGTKTEMERLIQDAEKLDDSFTATRDENGKLAMSYADIVDAIHIVQDNMGISGTTAKEASETIQGSVSSMQSAWQNLVTGMADENANIDVLMNNFVNSVFTVLDNIVPRIQELLPRLVEGITGLVDMLLPELSSIIKSLLPSFLGAVTSLVNSLFDILPDIIAIASELATTLVSSLSTALVDNIGAVTDAAIDIFLALLDALITAAPQLLDAAVTMINQIVDSLLDNIDLIIDSAISLVEALSKGLVQNLPKLAEAAGRLISGLTMAILDHLPKLLKAGWDLLIGLKDGVESAEEQLFLAAANLMKSLLEKIGEFLAPMLEAGKNLLGGLIDGIKSKVADAVQAVKDAVGSVINGAKKILGIASPSKVFKGFGQNTMQGYIDGVKSKESALKQEMDNAISVLVDDYEKKIKESEERLKQFQKDKNNEAIAEEERYLAKLKQAKEDALRYNEDYSAAVAKSSANASEFAKAIQSNLDDIKKQYEDIVKAQESMASRLADYGSLYSKDDYGVWLNSLEDQIATLDKYGESLEKLRARGVSDDFLNEIANMDINDAIAVSERLLSMSDTRFEKYLAQWDEKNRKAQEIAETYYKEQISKVENEYNTALEDGMKVLEQTGFNSGINTIDGLIAGMRSQREEALAATRSLADEIAATFSSALEIKSPSKLFYRFGKFIDAGAAQGITDNANLPLEAVRSMVGGMLEIPTVNVFPQPDTSVGDGLSNMALAMQGMALSNAGASSGGGEIIMQVNGETFARLFAPYFNRENNIRGNNIVEGDTWTW